jgi:hypothetical protein
MHAIHIYILIGVALVISGCSDDKESKPQGTKEPQSGSPQTTVNPSAPPSTTTTNQTLPGIDTEKLAMEFGVPANTVISMLLDVKQFRERISSKLSDSTSISEVVNEIKSLADSIARVSKPLPLSSDPREPISLAVLAGVQDGPEPSAAACRAGFLGLPPEQLSSQLKLYAGTQEVARLRADHLSPLLSGRAASSTATAADWALYAAVTDGVQDNPDFQHADSPTTSEPRLPYAAELLRLARAKNAVYRLLAVKLAPQLERDRAKLSVFYQQFANDHEEVIRRTAIQGLKGVNPPNLDSILKAFAPTEGA